MFETTGCDAVTGPRGARRSVGLRRSEELARGRRPAAGALGRRGIAACLEHLRFSIDYKGDERHAIVEFRKFYKGYLRGAPGAAQLRADLMSAATLVEIEERLAAFTESVLVETA